METAFSRPKPPRGYSHVTAAKRARKTTPNEAPHAQHGFVETLLGRRRHLPGLLRGAEGSGGSADADSGDDRGAGGRVKGGGSEGEGGSAKKKPRRPKITSEEFRRQNEISHLNRCAINSPVQGSAADGLVQEAKNAIKEASREELMHGDFQRCQKYF